MAEGTGACRAWRLNPAATADTFAARLERFDLAGRRVARCEVGGLGPGRHGLVLGTGSRLGAGIYFLRLAQGGRTLHARVA